MHGSFDCVLLWTSIELQYHEKFMFFNLIAFLIVLIAIFVAADKVRTIIPLLLLLMLTLPSFRVGKTISENPISHPARNGNVRTS